MPALCPLVRLRIAVTGMAVLLGPPGPAGATTLNPGQESTLLEVLSNDEFGFASNSDSPAALPFVGSAISTGLPPSRARAFYSLDPAEFEIRFDGKRTFLPDALARSRGDVYFSVSSATSFLLSGDLTVTEQGTTGRAVTLDVILEDVLTGSVVARSRQQSVATHSEAFTVGGTGGDFENLVEGTLSGLLVAGRTYRFGYDASIDASAAGAHSHAFFHGAAVLQLVPEPGIALLMGLPLLSTLAGWMRHPRRDDLAMWGHRQVPGSRNTEAPPDRSDGASS